MLRPKVMIGLLVLLGISGAPCCGFVLPGSRGNSPCGLKPSTGSFSQQSNALFGRKGPVYFKSPNQEKSDERNLPKFQVPSPYTLVIDALAILLAVEVVGLVNEINDPNFISKGGWFQPLPSLEEQSLELSQVLQAWILNLSFWATTLTVVPVVVGLERWSRHDANPWTTRFVPACLGFSTLRVLYTVFLASFGSESSIDWEPALLDVYTVALFLGTARYLLGNE